MPCLVLAIEIVPPQNVQVTYSEKSIDLFWDSIPSALGYNIYTGTTPSLPQSKKIKINKNLIVSGPHFTYLWHFENGEKVRKIKGYAHYIAISAVYEVDGKERESGLSEEINNCYFDNFKNITTVASLNKVLKDSQVTPLLPFEEYKNKKKQFISFMTGAGKILHSLIEKQIDPQQTGGCTPVTTILVKLLQRFGMQGYRVDGTFIKEFHSFVIINIDNVEYILDFTADQFVPDVSPVLIPRDYCFLDGRGKLAKSGTPIYSVAKVYNADQIELSDDPEAQLYQNIYATVLKKYPKK